MHFASDWRAKHNRRSVRTGGQGRTDSDVPGLRVEPISPQRTICAGVAFLCHAAIVRVTRSGVVFVASGGGRYGLSDQILSVAHRWAGLSGDAFGLLCLGTVSEGPYAPRQVVARGVGSPDLDARIRSRTAATPCRPVWFSLCAPVTAWIVRAIGARSRVPIRAPRSAASTAAWARCRANPRVTATQ